MDLDAQIEQLYDRVDDLLCQGRFDLVDQELLQVDVASAPVELLVAWLIITLPAGSKLVQRGPFVELVRNRLADDPERDAILHGLEQCR
jgi:hypothetical protein